MFEQKTQSCDTPHSNDDVVFFLRPKMTPRFTYLDVRIEKDGTLSFGSVTTHLDLEDWSSMNGYKLLGFEKRVSAQDSDRTSLVQRAKPEHTYKRSKTVIGIPTPSPGPMTPIAADVIKMIG